MPGSHFAESNCKSNCNLHPKMSKPQGATVHPLRETWRHGLRSPKAQQKGLIMLNWILTFLIIALIAGVLGFAGVSGTAIGIAQVLFLVFLVVFLVSLLFGRRRV
jgi:uncharacterized membrane protein YtjA (UPF0391 family)